LGRVSEKLIAPLLFALIPEATVPFFIDEIGTISCPFVEQKNKERNDRAAVEAMVNQHGFKTYSWDAVVTTRKI